MVLNKRPSKSLGVTTKSIGKLNTHSVNVSNEVCYTTECPPKIKRINKFSTVT